MSFFVDNNFVEISISRSISSKIVVDVQNQSMIRILTVTGVTLNQCGASVCVKRI